ncbi:SDR family NAD(P)-dependent oxidoreductase [Pseudonocardia xishanensis]|uniref:SDR family NAD(P)-dependent oxidoreductase n=1 Tax=Pseudonocardia xishanensis TaxID=630995 RepID=A0ABP8RYV2_9PSEU
MSIGARFEGRAALITGGASGLGFSSAVRLAEEGATIGILDLKQEAVDAAVAQLRERGAAVHGFHADVTDEAAVHGATSEFAARAGSLDVLVAMAGIYPWVSFEDMTQQIFRQVVDVNLTGTFTCAHAAFDHMKQQGYGRIVTCSSGTVLAGTLGQSAYISSKMGVIGLTRVLAMEGGPVGVTANCILPGLVATDQVLKMSVDVDAFFDEIIAEQAVKRRGKPADISEAVAYLASEEAGFVSGQSLAVSGGHRFL